MKFFRLPIILEILKRLILSLRAIYAQPNCNINDSAPNMNKSNLNSLKNHKICFKNIYLCR